MSSRPSVLVFAGLDPSGGAGISADIEAIGAQGSHALPVITALTVQDNDRVFAVHPVDTAILRHQAQALVDKVVIDAVKIGIVGSHAIAQTIVDVIRRLREKQPDLPVVLDTVLASGQGDALSQEDPTQAVLPLLELATLVTPNLPEAFRLCPNASDIATQAQQLLARGAQHVLIKGGHGDERDRVLNRWFTHDDADAWWWPRLPGEFHGSGCTLASAIAGLLAQGKPMRAALGEAQQYAYDVLASAYAIAPGQQIPNRMRKN